MALLPCFAVISLAPPTLAQLPLNAIDVEVELYTTTCPFVFLGNIKALDDEIENCVFCQEPGA